MEVELKFSGIQMVMGEDGTVHAHLIDSDGRKLYSFQSVRVLSGDTCTFWLDGDAILQMELIK